ncbi:endonuclease V-like [Lineus longissimus]|uniref:endonuclease V-like n=1 Tax=Lineus longissimus TaxID=88925 RepID=UPI002B4F2ADF
MGCINTKKYKKESRLKDEDEVRPSHWKKEFPSLDEDIRTKWEKEQLELKKKLILENTEEWQQKVEDDDETSGLQYIGGVDISFVKGDTRNACAALVVCKFPSLEVVYEDCTMVELTAPYIPGFLAFREADFLVERFYKLRSVHPEYLPQLVLVDGNGLLHPREFGLACHLGVLLDLPAAGVAKKLFQVDGLENDAKHKEKIDGLRKGGDTFPLVGSSGRTLGVALRSNEATKNPVYVSAGHKISLEATVTVVKKCCKHRIPEPVRQADIRSREFLRVNFKAEDSVDGEER